jgi:hypothetical protein
VNLSNPSSGVGLGTSSTTVSIVGAWATVAPQFDTHLTIHIESGATVLTWAGGGQLQRADRVGGPWQTLLTATNPYGAVSNPRYLLSGHSSQTREPLRPVQV